jgi:uncharacterized membrane protein
MNPFFRWWYALSLPLRAPVTTPREREQQRYEHLTAGLLLLIVCVFLPLAPLMLFFSPQSPSARPDAIGLICLLLIAWIAGRVGRQRLSASCIIACTFLAIGGPLATDPLNTTLVPLFGVFTISIILAGSLLPPVAALITGFFSCLAIVAIAMISLNLHTYTQGTVSQYQGMNVLALAIILPMIIQIVVAVIVYVIMRNLLTAIHRADQAEQIVSLQMAIRENERERLREHKQLEDGLEKIAEAHSRIANGDYYARVSLAEGDVLWSIAIPLNNLLNRLQSWKADSDMLLMTRQAAGYIAQQMRVNFQSGQQNNLPLTRTSLDPVIVELNRVLAASQSVTRSSSRPLV